MALTATQLANAYFAVTDEQPNAATLATLVAIDATQGDSAAISAIVNDPVSQNFAWPVLRIFQIVTGAVPNATQLHGWEGFLENGGALSQVAAAFAAGTFFSVNYNNGNPVNPNGPANLTEMINIIANSLGLDPHLVPTTQAQAWVNASNAPGGPTLSQIIVDFATGDQFSASTLPFVRAFLADVANANLNNPAGTSGFPTGSLFLVPVPHAAQILTLTVGQDFAITGQPFNGTGDNVQGGNVVVNAPISGIFGGQDTLTPFDQVSLTGTGNTLNAFFNGVTFGGGGGAIGGLTLQGLQTWNLANAGGTVELSGNANLGNGAPGAGNNGVQTITYQNSTGSIRVGTLFGAGLQSVVNTINVLNDTGFFYTTLINDALFGAANALQVNVANVGVGERISAGGVAGTAGYATWNINVQDAVGDTIDVGLRGGATTTVNVTDTGGGGLTLNQNPFFFGSTSTVATVNGAAMTAGLVVTGAESGATGFLTGDGALKTITGGAGNDKFDLSGYGTAALKAITINGGGGSNTVEIASGVVTDPTLTPLTNMTNEQTVDIVGGVAGTIVDTNFSGVTTFRLVSTTGGTGGSLSGNLAVTKAVSGLTFDFNSSALNGHSFTITDASTTNLTDSVTLAAGGVSITGAETIATNGFSTVNLATDGDSDAFFGPAGFTATPNPGAGITINTSGAGDIAIGTAFLFTDTLTAASVGTATVITHGGAINYNNAEELALGITDASLIKAGANASSAAEGTGLIMMGPTFALGDNVLGAAAGSNTLQGSISAALVADAANGNNNDGSGATVYHQAGLHNDIIGGGNSGDNIWGDGGQDAITLGTAGATDHVVFGEIGLNNNGPGNGGNPVLEFTNAAGVFQDPINFSGGTVTSSYASTIANFSTGSGTGHDVIDFRIDSWGWTGGAGYDGLVAGNQTNVAPGGDANIELITSAGATILGPTNVVADAVANYADGAHLLTALTGGGGLVLSTPTVGFDDMLFAYSDGSNVHIADVRIDSGSATTAGALAVHDLVVLTGVSSVASLANADIHFA